jgi:feruloyl esterase
LHDAVIKACDKLDGVEDGVLEDPRRCTFDPATLQCGLPSTAAGACLTAGQIAAARGIYAGVLDPITGRSISPGLSRGSELLWGPFATPGRPFPIPISYYRWLVFGDSTWDWRSFDLANPRIRQAWLDADRKFTPILAATDPNLRAFRERGGKLIQYHGWNDQLITPQNSVDYYESVVALETPMGTNRAATLGNVRQFYRLFMVPGMAHCAGGDGTSVFDMERVLEDWVERGTAPDSVLAAHPGPVGVPDRRRPLCPYPRIAAYKGQGDPNDAASFTCREPGAGTGRP